MSPDRISQTLIDLERQLRSSAVDLDAIARDNDRTPTRSDRARAEGQSIGLRTAAARIEQVRRTIAYEGDDTDADV